MIGTRGESMSLKIICSTCNGEGTVNGMLKKKTCPDCVGEGRVTTFSANMLAKVSVEEL